MVWVTLMAPSSLLVNVSRFTHRKALIAFAGVDPGVDQSGQQNSKSNRPSKVGSAGLRKTLFQIMTNCSRMLLRMILYTVFLTRNVQKVSLSKST